MGVEMPFASKSQARWMFATHPEMAKKWASHTPSLKSLPEKVRQKALKKALLDKPDK